MKTTRALIYRDARAIKALMAVECASVTQAEAKVPAHISLESIKAGMVFRLAVGRAGDSKSTRTIQRVDQKKTGQSTLVFEMPKAGASAFPNDKTP